MAKVLFTAELEYSEGIFHGGNDPSDIRWFREDILRNGNLTLYSKEIGDELGKVTVFAVCGVRNG